MYNLTDFTLKDMTLCGSALRALGSRAESMEDVSGLIVRYLYDNLIDPETGRKACTLVRLFKTHSWGQLEPKLQEHAQKMAGNQTLRAGTSCLTLLGTVGERVEWNSRWDSINHRVIPLVDRTTIEAAPMILNLVKQLGLDIQSVVQPDPGLILDLAQKTFNVFHVPNAVGSPFIPAQKDFVVSYGVKSVLGCGGILPSGNLFVVILFSKVSISKEVASLFKPLALNLKIAVMPFEDRVFS